MKIQEIMDQKDMEVVKSDPKEITLQDKKTKIKTVVPSGMVKKDPKNPTSPDLVLSKDVQPTSQQPIRTGQKVKVAEK